MSHFQLPCQGPRQEGVTVRYALSFRERLFGLMGRGADKAEALYFPACRSVHTCCMRFPLDLFWLDARKTVIRIDRSCPPWRVRRCADAEGLIEVPSDSHALRSVKLGLQLRITQCQN